METFSGMMDDARPSLGVIVELPSKLSPSFPAPNPAIIALRHILATRRTSAIGGRLRALEACRLTVVCFTFFSFLLSATIDRNEAIHVDDKRAKFRGNMPGRKAIGWRDDKKKYIDCIMWRLKKEILILTGRAGDLFFFFLVLSPPSRIAKRDGRDLIGSHFIFSLCTNS